jgi:hypothetical protein
MLTKLFEGCVVLTFIGASQADALGLGLGKRGGGKSTSTSSSSASSSSNRGGVSVGVSAGRRGISTNVSVGRSVSAGASVGAGGVSASAAAGSVNTNASVSRSGVSATVGAAGASVSVGAGSAQDTPASDAPQTTAAPMQAAAGTRIFALPLWLLPLPQRDGAVCPSRADCERADLAPGKEADIGAPGTPDFDVREGTPEPIVQACRAAAATAAREYAALSVTAASAGQVSATGDGGVIAPVTIRIVYPGEGGGTMIRQAQVRCAMSGDGRVTTLA